MLITIRHTSRYRYRATARYSVQTLRLTPPSFEGQRVKSWTIDTPGLERAAKFRDGFGNVTHLVTVCEPHDEILVVAGGVVETADRAGVVCGLPEISPRRVFLRSTPQTEPDGGIRDLAAAVPDDNVLGRMHALMNAVRDAIDYETGTTDGQTTAGEALRNGKGVCQDHAHVFIAAARCLGIPARYVNGYYLTGGTGSAEAHHAWAEAWVEGLGWVGFDPANRLCPTEEYVRLACGLDAAAAAPIRGSRQGGGSEALDVNVQVEQQGVQQQG